MKMPPPTANCCRATELAEHEPDPRMPLEDSGMDHPENAQRISQEISQPRQQERRFAETGCVAPARPRAARMNRTRHIEGLGQLENRLEARIIKRDVAVVRQEGNATRVRKLQIALQLTRSVLTCERINRGSKDKVVVTSGPEVVGDRSVVPPDDV